MIDLPMSKPRLELKAHLSVEELEAGYRKCQDPIERSHWQIIWLYAQYENAAKVAEMTAYSGVWVRALVKRYNEAGKDSLRDLRHDNPGEACVLSDKQQASLVKALAKDAPGLSLWTGPKVAQWIEAKTKVKVHATTGWRYLVRLDHSLQVPRPRHKKAAPPEAQAAFKKN
jgi:transposase